MQEPFSERPAERPGSASALDTGQDEPAAAAVRPAVLGRLRELARDKAAGIERPVALAGAANLLIFASLDYSHWWTLAPAAAGMGLVGSVLLRQFTENRSLRREAAQRSQQLTVVSGVVSSLNASLNVGGALGTALEQLVTVLEADAGVIWLPSAAGEGLVLVEQKGLPDVDRAAELLEQVQAAASAAETTPLSHAASVPGATGPGPARCLTVKLGRRAEEFGFLTLVRWSGEFGLPEGAVLDAIGSDIGGALRSVRMITETRKLADRDPVTLLYNHRSGYQRLSAELEKHAKSGAPLAILMMDLENFKLFNDTYGHPAGDEVLKRVSGVLRKCSREEDILARYGGDEFMLVLPNTGLQAAVKCAERIRAALSKERFRCENSATLPIGLSFGISVFPDDGKEVLGLVSTAERHLLQSKTAGDGEITTRGAVQEARRPVQIQGVELFDSMVTAIDNKDCYTRRHSEEVTEYSLQIGRALGLDEKMLETIQISGILHDVGKIGVPDAILKKPGHLTDEEFAILKQHPVLGAHIVGAMGGMEEVVLGVRHHHERFDGRGYPDRLAGVEIPLIGRIMAVADAFSAMTTSRPYRKGLTERQALLEIERNLGSQFDPDLGALFVRLRREGVKEAPEKAEKPKPVRKPRARKTAAAEPPEPVAAEA